MAKIDLNLGKSKAEKYSIVEHYENSYKNWRQYRKNINEPFFMVPSEILEYVSSIKSRAISLYLYYSYRAGNSTGKSWPSVERAAEDLSISTKSVNNWNNELESLGLIARINEGKSSKSTYLLPVSDFYYFENNATPKQFVEYSTPEVDGKLLCIFHLFQWRKEDTDEYTKPYNVTCLIYQRSYEPDETNNNKKKFVVTKAILFEEEEYKDLQVNKTAEEFSSDHHAFLFETEKRKYALNTKVIGIAVTSKINLKETKKTNEVLDLIQQLVQGFETGVLEKLPTVEISKQE